MKDDNKNVYVAIALSILVIIGWNFFYGYPQMQKQRQAQLQAYRDARSRRQSTPVTASGRPGVSKELVRAIAGLAA